MEKEKHFSQRETQSALEAWEKYYASAFPNNGAEEKDLKDSPSMEKISDLGALKNTNALLKIKSGSINSDFNSLIYTVGASGSSPHIDACVLLLRLAWDKYSEFVDSAIANPK